jgi:hypothetical protein
METFLVWADADIAAKTNSVRMNALFIEKPFYMDKLTNSTAHCQTWRTFMFSPV